ncbi:MAG: UTRA domain-containing protein [Pseudomonadales bacterium]
MSEQVSEQSPVYLQLRDQLLHWIERHQLSSGDKLPSERELAQRCATTRVTLRQALGQLEAQGRIYREHRRGWFITPPRIVYDPSVDIGFYQYVKQQGMIPATETLSRRLIEAPATLIEALALPLDTQVYHFVRRRSIDGRAVLIEHNYVNSASCPGLLEKDTDLSLWRLLRTQYEIEPGQRTIELYPRPIDAEQAVQLGVTQGCAGLYLERTSYDFNGDFLEYDVEYWLHDALKCSVQVTSPPTGAL